MTRHKIIVNPIAGRGDAGKAIPQIEGELRRYGLEYDLVCTERPGHAVDLAREAAADRFDVVVVASGDGTANEVLNGLMSAGESGLSVPAMGVLAVGRGNDLACGWGIPTGVEAGCRVLADGYRKRIDVGWVAGGLYPDGRYFGNGVGIGFDAVVGFVALKLKHLHGFASYLVAALETIFLYYKAPLVTVEFGGTTVRQRTLMVSIMNGRRMGGGFWMAPTSQIDDGLFDLCIARQVSRGRIFTLIPHFMKGTQATQEPIQMGQATHLVVTAVEGVLPAHADGETLCTEGRRLECKLLSGRIEILTAQSGAGAGPAAERRP